MAELRTRWMMGRPVDSTPILGKPGLCPSIWRHVKQRPGLWMGALDVRAMGIQLVALTWDLETISQSSFDADVAKLLAAPVADALVLPTTGNLGAWGKIAALKSRLELGKQDGQRFTGAMDWKEATQDLARGLLLYQALRADEFLTTRDLGEKPSSLPAKARARIEKRLAVYAIRRWKQADSFRKWMRDILDRGFAWALVAGSGFSLGRREANLR